MVVKVTTSESPSTVSYRREDAGYYGTSREVVREQSMKSAQISFYLSKDSVSTSSFAKTKATGMLPMNPYSYYKKTTVWPSGQRTKTGWIFMPWISPKPYVKELETYSGHGSNQLGVWMVNDGEAGSLSPEEKAEIKAAATSELLTKIKDQKVNVAQFWAEREQTVQLIATTAMRLVQSFRDLKRGNITSAAKGLTGMRPSRRIRRGYRKAYSDSADQAAAQAWLEMQYGWKPLLSDVEGAFKAMRSRISDQQDVRCSAFRKATRQTKSESSGFYTPNGGLKCTQTTTYEYTVKYTSFHRVTQSTTATLASIGLTNPALLAWELVPYSFVVDWFLPVGNFLNTLDATMGITFNRGCVTEVERWKHVFTWSPDPDDSKLPNPMATGVVYYKYDGFISSTVEIVKVKREVIPGFPSPQLPSFKNPLSVTHAANALALLTTTFRRA